MKFYTNIQLIGNQFLIRGYENGKHITHREEWKPTLFVPSKRKTKYKTLEGDLQKWMEDYTEQNEIMINSDKIVTLVTPSPMIFEKYSKVTS